MQTAAVNEGSTKANKKRQGCLVINRAIRCHRWRQLAVVKVNHCSTVAHLLAERVYVSAPTQEFKSGVGVPQRLQRPVLPILVFQQARVTHQSHECAVQGWRLVAVTEHEQLVGHTLGECLFKRQCTDVLLA